MQKKQKMIDGISIEQIGIPSLVLMERAALAVAKRVEELAKKRGFCFDHMRCG